jgi:hypothetical protein
MRGELHQASDIQANIYMSIREHVCTVICPGGRKCHELKCLSAFFFIVGEIEKKIEAKTTEGRHVD